MSEVTPREPLHDPPGPFQRYPSHVAAPGMDAARLVLETADVVVQPSLPRAGTTLRPRRRDRRMPDARACRARDRSCDLLRRCDGTWLRVGDPPCGRGTAG